MSNLARLPQGWSTAALGAVAHSITSGATPEAGNRRYYTQHGGYPFAKIEDLTRAPSRELEHCALQITEAAVRETSAKVYPAGTILLSMYGTIGLAKICAQPLAANQALCALLPPFGCDSAFLLHHLDYVRPQWSRYSGQTTQANINGAVVRAHEIPLPPSAEQVAIRRVLDTLDTTIRKTEAIIEKLKQVKQGLLHDLLTRGIDANGELRPPQSQAPHLYKDSPLGWIPSEWDCGTVSSRLAVLGGKRLPAGHAYAERRTPYRYLRVTDFFEREYNIDELESLEQRTFDALQRYEIAPGQLYISIAGSLGHVGVHSVPAGTGVRVVLTENAARLVPIAELCPGFAAAYLNSRMAQRQIGAEKGTGGGVPKLALFRIENLMVAWPSQHEQELIVERLDAVTQRIRLETRSAEALRQLKTGLMDDLLIGRVRVTPLLV